MMTTDKARDNFSAYFEKNLDQGMTEAMERTLANNAELREEYELFSQTVNELGDLRYSEIPIPIDLHRKIVTKLDAQVSKQPKQATFLHVIFNARNFAIAAVAATLLVGAGLALFSANGGDDPMEAGTVGPIRKPAAPKVMTMKTTVEADGTYFTFRSPRPVNFVMRWDTNELFTANPGRNETIRRRVENTHNGPAEVKIEVDGAVKAVLILPGTVALEAKTGEGSFEDFAKSLAGHYQVPVLVDGIQSTEQVKWDFAAPSASQAASLALGTDHKLDPSDDGVVRIH